MIQHVALEAAAGDVDAHRAFWPRLGFAEIDPPEALRGRSVWFEAGPTQLHLLLTDDPVVAPRGHVAVRVDDLDALGLELEERERHWGQRRCFVRAPGGHTVEVFEVPPP